MKVGRPRGSYKHGISIYEVRKALRKKSRAEKLLSNLNILRKTHRTEINMSQYEYNLLLEIKRITGKTHYEIFRSAIEFYANQVFKLNAVVPKTTERGVCSG